MKEIIIVYLTDTNHNPIEIPQDLKTKIFKSYSAVAKAVNPGKIATVKVTENTFLQGFGEVKPIAEGRYYYPARLNHDW